MLQSFRRTYVYDMGDGPCGPNTEIYFDSMCLNVNHAQARPVGPDFQGLHRELMSLCFKVDELETTSFDTSDKS